jgi:BCD family chlorophyll transporter-like MFS transporter
MSWLSILRLGLVNAALGAVVTLTTITLNRVMVVELALPAILPGALVALHYAMQILRPRLGFGADIGGKRTPWILGGLGVLCAGGVLAALGVAAMAQSRLAGLALAVPAFALVGAGVGSTGTNSLTMLAALVAPGRRAAAATIFWLLMIFGAVLTAGLTSALLHPFSLGLLLRVAGGVAGMAFLVGCLALWGLEGTCGAAPVAVHGGFMAALRAVWRDRQARAFTLFVFVSMLAYSGQELILEPFAGAVLRLSPSATAGLSGLHQSGLLGGMLLVAVAGSLVGAGRVRAMRGWAIGGCVASGLLLLGLGGAAVAGPVWPLRAHLVALGVANGAFTIAAVGAMMGLAGSGHARQAGMRMGLWGAAQAIAMGCGGLLSAGSSDIARAVLGAPSAAYAAVFIGQAVLFLVAAGLARGVFGSNDGAAERRPTAAPMGVAA